MIKKCKFTIAGGFCLDSSLDTKKAEDLSCCDDFIQCHNPSVCHGIRHDTGAIKTDNGKLQILRTIQYDEEFARRDEDHN